MLYLDIWIQDRAEKSLKFLHIWCWLLHSVAACLEFAAGRRRLWPTKPAVDGQGRCAAQQRAAAGVGGRRYETRFLERWLTRALPGFASRLRTTMCVGSDCTYLRCRIVSAWTRYERKQRNRVQSEGNENALQVRSWSSVRVCEAA